MRTGPRLVVAAVLAALAGTVLAVPAQAAACEQDRGVTVVVDFGRLGGVETDCAPGDPASGVEALRGSGHEPTRAAQQPGYFVCRIDGLPADDPCQRASPEDAYWSYWSARPGGSWTYNNVGPADRDPEPGSVEGWAFGAGDPPSVAPPRERSAEPPPPTPARTPASGSSPKAAAPAPVQAVTPARSPSPAAASPTAAPTSAAPSVSPSTAAPSGSPTGSGSPSPEPELTPGPVVVDRVDDDGPGSLAGVLAALGVVLLLAAAGAYQVSQRRSRDEIA